MRIANFRTPAGSRRYEKTYGESPAMLSRRYKTRAEWLGPGVAAFGKGQGTNAVAGGGEDGVGDGGERWRKRRLAQTGGRIVSLQVMDFDGCRRLIYTHRFVFVEIALFGAAAVDGDFASHEIAESFRDSALRLIFGVERIDDLAADVANAPDFFNLHFFRRIHVNECDGRKMAAVREVKRDAHASAFRQGAFAPVGFFRGEF